MIKMMKMMKMNKMKKLIRVVLQSGYIFKNYLAALF